MDTNSEPDLAGARTVLVASTGGHLAQLAMLRGRLRTAEGSLWITFDSPQARSVLNGERVTYVGYIKPRGYVDLIRAVPKILRALRTERPDAIVSTGAAIAVAALPLAVLCRVRRVVYIESFSRFSGPSLTGRILRWVPRLEMYTQHASWSDARWKATPPVLTGFRRTTKPAPVRERLRVFVTLGTIKPFRFDALVDALVKLASSVDFVWQLGETTRDTLPGVGHAWMSAEDFDRAARDADVVVAHAGVGTALRLLEIGHYAILVPRRAVREEHVDDHQTQVAAAFDTLGIAKTVEAPKISLELLREASLHRVVSI